MRLGSKICGLSERRTLDAALDAGAAMVGFVFYPPSPRAVRLDQAAMLADAAKGRSNRVGLFVDPDDETLKATLEAVDLDWIQLHGKETAERVAAVKAAFGRPVMKALRIRSRQDLDAAAAYTDVADRLLFDAPPPDGPNALPGGNGDTFDWRLLADRKIDADWMLAGGLTPENVGAAITQTHAPGVDVSSGVETAPGAKDSARIAAFLAAALKPSTAV